MRPYAGIPHPHRPGLFVAENVALLRRFAYVEERLFVLEAGHFPGMDIWEYKHALARHAWEDAHHADALRSRIITMRTSAHLLAECPDPALAALMDEAERATDPVLLAAGVLGVVKPALLAAYRWHQNTTNPVADFPTARELEIIVREEAHQLAWGAEALEELAGAEAAAVCRDVAAEAGGFEATTVAASEAPPTAPAADLPGHAQAGPPIGAVQTPAPGAEERALAWQAHLRTFLAAAGGMDGRAPRGVAEPPLSKERFRVSRHPKRDPRFEINFNFNEPGDVTGDSVEEKLIFMMRGRLNELAATENPASAVFELASDAQPAGWETLVDLARHMWDEARHSMLGQAVLTSMGRDIREWPLRIGPGYTYLCVDAWERYAHLGLNVEQGMMRYPPGKRQEFEWCRDVAQYPLAAMYQDYDWSDEVYHTQIARRQVGRLLQAAGEVAGEAPSATLAERMKAFATAAAGKMGARSQAIGQLWHQYRAAGRTLADGDPLPTDVQGTAALKSEYDDPEITLTREQVEADLQHVE